MIENYHSDLPSEADLKAFDGTVRSCWFWVMITPWAGYSSQIIDTSLPMTYQAIGENTHHWFVN